MLSVLPQKHLQNFYKAATSQETSWPRILLRTFRVLRFSGVKKEDRRTEMESGVKTLNEELA